MLNGLWIRNYMCNMKWKYHIILSVLVVLSLTMEFRLPDYTDMKLVSGNEFIINIEHSLIVEPFQATLLFVMFFFWSIKIEQMNGNKIRMVRYKLFYGVCMAIGLVWLSAKSYLSSDSLVNIYVTSGQIGKSVIYYIGTVYLLILIGKTAFLLVDNMDTKIICREYPYIKKNRYRTWLFLGVMWLPHLIMAYPASVISDARGQLAMFYGMKAFTSHHPPFHTWLIGTAVSLGEKAGSANIGLFLLICFQSVIFLLIISYEIESMKKLNAPRWLVNLTMLIAGTSPYYTAYIGLITKDMPYSYFFLLFMIEIFYLFEQTGGYFESKTHTFLFILSSVAVILFRNNGKYVIYPMLLIVFALMIRKKFLFQTRKAVIRALSSMILIILIPVLINTTLIKVYNIEKGSVKEMLSLPFQQTARYVVNHGDEVSEEERQVIDKILDYDSLAQNYNPRLSDAVKNTFKQESTHREMLDYFRVWLCHFFRHPFTYISATMNQNYKLVYPYAIKYVYLETYQNRSGLMEQIGCEEVEQIKNKENSLRSFYYIMFDLPLIGMFSMIALYNLVLIYSLLYAFYRKLHSILLISVPLVICNLIIIAAPLVHPRYAFPIIYSIPLLVFGVFCAIRHVNQETEGKEVIGK